MKQSAMIIRFSIAMLLINSTSFGQTIGLDSCGLDKNAKLNKFEIEYIDKVLLADSVHDFKKGFEFTDKNIYFFACNEGFISKDNFFDKLKSGGHKRPRGILTLNPEQKEFVGLVDAVVIIDCKIYSDKELTLKLKQKIRSDQTK